MVMALRGARSRWQTWLPFRRALESPGAGLYTYRVGDRNRGQTRLHLRIQPDGAGVLFVDVTEVIHLNATAATIAKWRLDGEPVAHIVAGLRALFDASAGDALVQDVRSICDMVHRFQQPNSGCPTCALGQVHRAELFQLPVQAPHKADLAITYDCNNDCPHCYNEPDRLQLDSLGFEDWCRVIDRLVEVGIPHLIFTGGEATLHPDLPRLIRYADRQGPICGLNSNGRRFAHLPYARDMGNSGLNHLQVTLGSHRPEVHNRMMNADCFSQTIRGIQHAMECGIHTITNTTLMRMNAEEITTTIEFLDSLGIRTFAVNGLIYSGGGFATPMAIAEEELAAILIRIRDRARQLGMRFLWYTPTQYCRLSPVELEIGAKRCNAGEYSVCVEPNGDVLPCQSYYVAAGNLLRDRWETIWRGELFRSFRERELDPERHGLPEKCWECPDLPLCGGGCRIEREAADGNRVAQACGGCSSRGVGGCGSDGRATGFVPSIELVPATKRRGSGMFATP